MSAYAPGAPAEIWALDLDPGAKLTLMWLWSRADHDVQRDPEVTTVWAPAREGLTPAEALRAALAEATGQTPRAVRSHLGKLRKLGLAAASGRCVELTPPCQACHCGGKVDTTVADTTASSRDTTVASADTTVASRDTTVSAQLNPPLPPNSTQDPAIPKAPTPLVLVGEIGDDHARVRAGHERARAEALHQHGRPRTKLPSPTSKAGKALDARLRKALDTHGADVCLGIVGWQAQRWAEDPGQLAWSTEAVWSPKSVAFALGRIRGGPRSARGAPFVQVSANQAGDLSELPAGDVEAVGWWSE